MNGGLRCWKLRMSMRVRRAYLSESRIRTDSADYRGFFSFSPVSLKFSNFIHIFHILHEIHLKMQSL